MKLLVNKVSKRILALFLTVVSVFAAFGIHTPAKRTVTAKTVDAYVLVTDASTLVVGDEVIIAAKDSDVAISTTQNKNNRGEVAITKSGNTLQAPSAEVQVLTLEAGTKEGTFAFNTGTGYLYAASSSSNHLKTQADLSDNASWEIEIAADGTATIKAQGTYTRNWMRYNSTSSLFSCYASGQTDIVLYKLGQIEVADDVCTNHVYGDTPIETVAATCTEDGKEVYQCTNANCTETKTEILTALGHDETQTTVDSTCSVAGTVTTTCKREGCTYEKVEMVALLPHTWVKGVCSECGATQSVYAMVTDVATLAVGDEIIIVAKDSDFAMSTTQNSNNRGQAAIEKDVNVAIVDDTVQTITLATGKVADTFAFQVGEKYLYAAGGTKNNYLRVEAEKSENSSWSIEIDVDGNATIKTQSQEEGAKNWLRYNATSECFSCYASGQKDIAIYKLVGSAADFYAMTEEFSAMTTDASFKLGYTSGEVTSAKLRFGITMSKELCESLTAAGATFGFEVNSGDDLRDIHDDTWKPASTNNGTQYKFSVVIGDFGEDWTKEFTAKVYVEIGGKKYYTEAVTYSVNSLAVKYEETETDPTVLAILNVLKGGAA